jgi:hypothetical protein
MWRCCCLSMNPMSVCYTGNREPVKLLQVLGSRIADRNSGRVPALRARPGAMRVRTEPPSASPAHAGNAPFCNWIFEVKPCDDS